MRRLWTPRWILVHAAVLALVVAFLALGWWQVRRAASGNLLSFGYAVEWPAFAAFVIFIWVKEMRRTLRGPVEVVGVETSAAAPAGEDDPNTAPAHTAATKTAATRTSARTGPAYDDSSDEDLAAYNRYLAWLNAHPHASPSDFWAENH